jgi:hypothetical protein
VASGALYYIECKPGDYTVGAYTLCAAYVDAPDAAPDAAPGSRRADIWARAGGGR